MSEGNPTSIPEISAWLRETFVDRWATLQIYFIQILIATLASSRAEQIQLTEYAKSPMFKQDVQERLSRVTDIMQERHTQDAPQSYPTHVNPAQTVYNQQAGTPAPPTYPAQPTQRTSLTPQEILAQHDGSRYTYPQARLMLLPQQKTQYTTLTQQTYIQAASYNTPGRDYWQEVPPRLEQSSGRGQPPAQNIVHQATQSQAATSVVPIGIPQGAAAFTPSHTQNLPSGYPGFNTNSPRATERRTHESHLPFRDIQDTNYQGQHPNQTNVIFVPLANQCGTHLRTAASSGQLLQHTHGATSQPPSGTATVLNSGPPVAQDPSNVATMWRPRPSSVESQMPMPDTAPYNPQIVPDRVATASTIQILPLENDSVQSANQPPLSSTSAQASSIVAPCLSTPYPGSTYHPTGALPYPHPTVPSNRNEGIPPKKRRNEQATSVSSYPQDDPSAAKRAKSTAATVRGRPQISPSTSVIVQGLNQQHPGTRSGSRSASMSALMSSASFTGDNVQVPRPGSGAGQILQTYPGKQE